MPITILAFGRLADITGKHCWESATVGNTGMLREQLEHEFPELSKLKYTIAVNKTVVHSDSPIPADAIIALLPPFSGG